uniref:Uncharacterized protein n=1 Tax=Tetradesmus obliquus TaxID=3088 RepID=A0A383WEQ3_TETOB|eukprot:jgi/Sobl393_1/12579/SZX75206.1
MRVAVCLAKSIATLTLEPALVSVQPLGNSRTIIDGEGTAYVAPKHSWLVPLLSLLLTTMPCAAGISASDFSSPLLLLVLLFAMQVQPLGNSRTIIDIEGTAYVAPKRSWLVPLSMLLPVSIGIRATIRLGVRGALDTGRSWSNAVSAFQIFIEQLGLMGPIYTGRIELIDGQWHNLPRLPTLIREFNGLMMGSLPHLTEPWWSRGLEFVGDDYYKRQRLGLAPHRARATAAAAAAGVDVGGSGVNGRGQ